MTEDAGDVDRIASVLASTDVSTMDVGRDRVVGNASLGVLDDGGLEEEASPLLCSDDDILARRTRSM